MRIRILSSLLLLCSAVPASADNLVCAGGRIVETGMTIAQVRQKCGPPTQSEVRTVESRARGENGGVYKVGDTKVEIWRYDRGSRKQAAVIEFRDDKVFSINYVEDR